MFWRYCLLSGKKVNFLDINHSYKNLKKFLALLLFLYCAFQFFIIMLPLPGHPAWGEAYPHPPRFPKARPRCQGSANPQVWRASPASTSTPREDGVGLGATLWPAPGKAKVAGRPVKLCPRPSLGSSPHRRPAPLTWSREGMYGEWILNLASWLVRDAKSPC